MKFPQLLKLSGLRAQDGGGKEEYGKIDGRGGWGGVRLKNEEMDEEEEEEEEEENLKELLLPVGVIKYNSLPSLLENKVGLSYAPCGGNQSTFSCVSRSQVWGKVDKDERQKDPPLSSLPSQLERRCLGISKSQDQVKRVGLTGVPSGQEGNKLTRGHNGSANNIDVVARYVSSFEDYIKNHGNVAEVHRNKATSPSRTNLEQKVNFGNKKLAPPVPPKPPRRRHVEPELEVDSDHQSNSADKVVSSDKNSFSNPSPCNDTIPLQSGEAESARPTHIPPSHVISAQSASEGEQAAYPATFSYSALDTNNPGAGANASQQTNYRPKTATTSTFQHARPGIVFGRSGTLSQSTSILHEQKGELIALVPRYLNDNTSQYLSDVSYHSDNNAGFTVAKCQNKNPNTRTMRKHQSELSLVQSKFRPETNPPAVKRVSFKSDVSCISPSPEGDDRDDSDAGSYERVKEILSSNSRLPFAPRRPLRSASASDISLAMSGNEGFMGIRSQTPLPIVREKSILKDDDLALSSSDKKDGTKRVTHLSKVFEHQKHPYVYPKFSQVMSVSNENVNYSAEKSKDQLYKKSFGISLNDISGDKTIFPLGRRQPHQISSGSWFKGHSSSSPPFASPVNDPGPKASKDSQKKIGLSGIITTPRLSRRPNVVGQTRNPSPPEEAADNATVLKKPSRFHRPLMPITVPRIKRGTRRLSFRISDSPTAAHECSQDDDCDEDDNDRKVCRNCKCPREEHCGGEMANPAAALTELPHAHNQPHHQPASALLAGHPD
ncbi:uncharacterized protein LOC135222909 [Macrobrachium nipponense]|uniref:uncharacterized protein LOC135222909 n=1 Tax=Macrobrachium nipponense TaxID=159736 RepID=UPI0030C8ACD9